MSRTPHQHLGLIAGRGTYPFLFARAARRHGVRSLHAIGLIGDTDTALEKEVDSITWVHVGQLRRTADALVKHACTATVMVGQVKPGRLFQGLRPDLKALSILMRLPERNAHSLFGAVCDYLGGRGIEVLSAVTFLEDELAGAGCLNGIRPSVRCQADIDYALRVCRESARLDIGQALAVKRGTVLAVEGFEGTDRMIRRAGELGRGGITVVKLAKPGHDMRFDVPCIGMRTVESLVEARAQALAVHTGMTLILERDKVLDALRQAGICLIGVHAS